MLFDGVLLWLVFAVVLALWIPQNAQHEYAHVVAHRHWGAEIVGFVPYPTFKPYFTWASMTYRQPDDQPLDDTAEGVCAIAPQATNTLILSVLLGIRWWVPDMPVDVASVLTAWYLTNYVDGAVNLSTFYRGVLPWIPEPSEDAKTTDGWRLQTAWGLNQWKCRVGTAAWHVWFGFHLFVPPSVLG